MYLKQKNILLFYLLILLNGIRPSVSIVKEDVINENKKEEQTVLSPDDFANIPTKEIDLRKLGIKIVKDPTLGDKLEGDMVIPHLKHAEKRSIRLQRSAIRSKIRRWPNATVPYTLSSQYGTYARSIIAGAMDMFHKNTCIRFVPRDPSKHNDYIYIHPDNGCYSIIGRMGGEQPLSLVSGCIQIGIIAHELMHASGFFHEQSREDRDQYVQINLENIKPGYEDQFKLYKSNVADTLGQDYDYSSIMHYGETAFSYNGQPTIVKLRPSSVNIGQRDGLSASDIKELNLHYECASNSGEEVTPKTKPITRKIKPTTKETVDSNGAVLTMTSARPISCRKNSDCYTLREPCEWCHLGAGQQWTNQGCHCDKKLGLCVINRLTMQYSGSEKFLEYAYCFPEATWHCE